MKVDHYGISCVMQWTSFGLGSAQLLEQKRTSQESSSLSTKLTVLARLLPQMSVHRTSSAALSAGFPRTTSQSGCYLRLQTRESPISLPQPNLVRLHSVLIFRSPDHSLVDRSDRISKGGSLLFPPYTLVGWDQFAPSYEALKADPSTISKTDNLLGFGRPLYVPRFNHRDLSADRWIDRWHSVRQNKPIDLARHKLVNARFDDSPPDGAQASLAILSQRFALDVCFGHPDAVEFMDEAIASHLRVCLGTTEDRTWVFTTYGSEPLLSHVAASALHASPSAFDVLRTKLSSGMIEKGKSGELACRLLLLVGKDVFLRRIYAKRKILETDELLYCLPVPLLDYLEALFGPKIYPADESAAKAVKRAFENAKVNFSHWISMSEKIHNPKNMNWKYVFCPFHVFLLTNVHCIAARIGYSGTMPARLQCSAATAKIVLIKSFPCTLTSPTPSPKH